jgi:AraC family transcriptional regulator
MPPAAMPPLDLPPPEFTVEHLLDSGTVAVRHVDCRGTCRHRSAEECASHTHFVFPYRGLYLRHVDSDLAVADANHVLFFNEGQGYRVSHPVTGGDSSLVVSVDPAVLRELAPRALVRESAGALTFVDQHLRIDARAQALAMLLRHSLRAGTIEPLEAEGLSLTLVSRAIGPRTSRAPGASYARRRLVDRVKILLAGDLSRRWTLAQIAARVRGSPVYLTIATSCACDSRARSISSRNAKTCPAWPRTWVSRATVISRPPSGRRMARRRGSTGRRSAKDLDSRAMSRMVSCAHPMSGPRRLP